MKVAIMQPYFAPYIGYFQLIAAVDTFVFLDDVNYISRGWINRNRIMVNNSPAWLTLPLKKASQNKFINQIEIQDDDGWKNRMGKTFVYSYAHAPSVSIANNLLTELLQKAHGNLSSYLSTTIIQFCKILQIQTQIIPTSSVFPKGDLSGQDRIIDLCKKLGASTYINAIGGKALYSRQEFSKNGINLGFLNPVIPNLATQTADAGTLSILHLIAHGVGKEFPRGKVDFDDKIGMTK